MFTGAFSSIAALGFESRCAILRVIDSYLGNKDLTSWKSSCTTLNGELALTVCLERRLTEHAMNKKHKISYDGPSKALLQHTYDEYGDPLKENGQPVYGTQRWSTGEYHGQWKNGKYHGYGTLIKIVRVIWKKTLKGQWQNGVFHGHGTCEYTDGSVYVGNWERGFRSGFGELSKAGECYSGEWSKDSKHGHGTLKTDHLTYTGGWYYDFKHGHGVLEKESTKYEGAFRRNEKHGVGIMTYGDGSKYTGNFAGNSRTGYGTMVYAKRYGRSLKKYTGLWAYDKPDGLGEMIFTDGRIYTGGHRDGRMYDDVGTATMVWPDGKKCSAVFKHNGPVFNFLAQFFENDEIVRIKGKGEMKKWLANARKTNKRKRV